MKVEYAIGVGIGVLLVVLGISSIVYFFTVKQHIGHSASLYGNYFVAGLVCFFCAFVLLRLTIPAFIPLKKNNFASTRTCPYCGAILDDDATNCEKCKQQLD